ncbi:MULTISPECIES: SDR family NAD(P)-dependent oxidoreductase [Paenibacillus]|uniref:SDR family NAD(P)-dependent oxidoreductase n=1 Tax=Paenibacillus TaxID=44249 RepID=UPI001072109E|nr:MULTISPECIES: SDR family NAD(P)-dependent oxidoreductase [Paenibacillus]
MKKAGGEAITVPADVSRLSELEKLFQVTLVAFGKLDIVINNAGIIITKSIAEITEADFDMLFATNVKGSYFSSQEAVKQLILSFSRLVKPERIHAFANMNAFGGFFVLTM